MTHYPLTFLITRADALIVRALSVSHNTASTLASHLQKRSLYEVANDDKTMGFFQQGDPLDGRPPDVGPAMMAVLVLLFFVVVVGLFLISYTINLLLTLTIVESPPPIYLPLSTTSDPSPNNKPSQPAPSNRSFLTSSLRSTISHLTTSYGRLAPWRGIVATIGFTVATSVVHSFVAVSLATMLSNDLANFFASVVSALALARFNMVVTHIKITKPSQLTWLRRVLNTPWGTAKETLPAMALYALAVGAANGLAIYSARPEFEDQTRAILAVLDLAWCVLIVFPAYMVLVRVQASLVPEDQETVVVYDRTFGVEGSGRDGRLMVKDVVKSLGKGGVVKRVVMLVFKTVPIYMVVAGVFGMSWLMAAWAAGARFGGVEGGDN